MLDFSARGVFAQGFCVLKCQPSAEFAGAAIVEGADICYFLIGDPNLQINVVNKGLGMKKKQAPAAFTPRAQTQAAIAGWVNTRRITQGGAPLWYAVRRAQDDAAVALGRTDDAFRSAWESMRFSIREDDTIRADLP